MNTLTRPIYIQEGDARLSRTKNKSNLALEVSNLTKLHKINPSGSMSVKPLQNRETLNLRTQNLGTAVKSQINKNRKKNQTCIGGKMSNQDRVYYGGMFGGVG